MPPDKSKSVKLKNKMSESFRLTLHKNPNFEEKGRVNFSLFQFYLFVFLGLTALVIFVASMIIFTPIRGLIPGYGDLSHPKKIRELSMALEDMEARLQANELYTTNFMKMLKDSTQTVDDVGSDLPVQSSVKTQIVEKVKEDAEIRQEIAFSNQNNDNMTLTTNSDQQSISLDRIYFLPPLMGPVSATYEPNKKHYGIDILAPKNTPIKASLDGYVIQSDWTMDAGNTLGIQHDNNIVTFYKHNSTLLKKVGDQVKAGEAIAIIGNSGELTDGPHLHFEIWHKGKTINPADFVEF
jgi:murein DD-endopeptidase MepM/ murein hydrolase activator NlpD